MSLTTGQHQYLLEFLSHEYVLEQTHHFAVRQAICRYATTAYDQSELDFLLNLAQSPLPVCTITAASRDLPVSTACGLTV